MARLKSDGIAKAESVEPIKNVKDIKKVKQYLLGKENKRDYMLFVVGINVGLRVGDLLSLKINDIMYQDGSFKDKIVIDEQKTDKVRAFKLNTNAREAIKLYLDSLKGYEMNDYLFKSRKINAEGTYCLGVDSAHKIIKSTMRELKIKGNYGTHTLRKTWAYQTYITQAPTNPMILPTLQEMLNHSSQKVTLRYIGIEQEQMNDIYDSVNL